MEMFQAFLSGSKPDCQELTMETIDIYNNKSTESHFVTLIDIQNMDPCVFSDKTNPVTKSKCRETFTNLKQNQSQTNNNECYTCYKIPKDPITQVYFASVGLLSVFIFYKLLLKNGMLPKNA
jgi:protein-arginine kinase activator protein McsA